MAKFVVAVIGADDDNILTTSTWFVQKLLCRFNVFEMTKQ